MPLSPITSYHTRKTTAGGTTARAAILGFRRANATSAAPTTIGNPDVGAHDGEDAPDGGQPELVVLDGFDGQEPEEQRSDESDLESAEELLRADAQHSERSHQKSGCPGIDTVANHQAPQEIRHREVRHHQGHGVEPVVADADNVEDGAPDKDRNRRPMLVVRKEDAVPSSHPDAAVGQIVPLIEVEPVGGRLSQQVDAGSDERQEMDRPSPGERGAGRAPRFGLPQHPVAPRRRSSQAGSAITVGRPWQIRGDATTGKPRSSALRADWRQSAHRHRRSQPPSFPLAHNSVTHPRAGARYRSGCRCGDPFWRARSTVPYRIRATATGRREAPASPGTVEVHGYADGFS